MNPQPIRDLNQLYRMKAFLKENSEQDHLLFSLGTYTGLRLSDLLTLTVGHVRHTHISIRDGKTNRRQRVIIHPTLRQALDPYLIGKANQAYLISHTGEPNRPMEMDEVLARLKRTAIQAGMREFDQETMRRTFGYHLYKQGVEIEVLQKILGEPSHEAALHYIGWHPYPFFQKRFGDSL